MKMQKGEFDDVLRELNDVYREASAKPENAMRVRLARKMQPAFVRWVADERRRMSDSKEGCDAVAKVIGWNLYFLAQALAEPGKARSLMADLFTATYAEALILAELNERDDHIEVVDAFEEDAERAKQARIDEYATNGLKAVN